MFDVILYQPEIPSNTGAIIRLCANAGCRLHLVHPLGFAMDEKKLRRAGLDYKELTSVTEYPDLETCLAQLGPKRLFALTSKTTQHLHEAQFEPGDALMFGPETRGLPRELVESLPESQRIRIPMMPENRSLNLANAVSIVVYEAWRQNNYAGSLTFK
jgi:tRNA (cytidine/uridine-2'-O-)-methyltransferase